MNKKIVKEAMILTAFTLVLGLILGVVNEITKGPIAKVNYEAEQESYRNVFKDADSFEEYKDFDAKKASLRPKKQRISSLRAIMPMMRSYL